MFKAAIRLHVCFKPEPKLFVKICFSFNHLYLCVSLCGYVQLNAGACRSQQRVSDRFELELQAVVSHLTSVLRTKLKVFRLTF